MAWDREAQDAREIEIESNWRKARNHWARMRGAAKLVGLAALLSFAYTTGELAGLEACQQMPARLPK